MPIDNQIEIPQSFMAMYILPGHSRPNAQQEVVLARYEQCEDMAAMLTEHAQTLVVKENCTESEVLVRCLQGLTTAASDFTSKEAEWVICRLAELMDWGLAAAGNSPVMPSDWSACGVARSSCHQRE